MNHILQPKDNKDQILQALQKDSGYTYDRRAEGFGLIHVPIKPEKGVLLRLMPPRVNIDMDKGYDNNDWLC